jgi:hypothetical protein
MLPSSAKAMMLKTKKRKKISSAAVLREEDGVGRKVQASARSRHLQVGAPELPPVARVERAVLLPTEAVHPHRPVHLESEPEPEPPALAAPRSVRVQPRLVDRPLGEQAPVGRRPHRGRLQQHPGPQQKSPQREPLV